MFNQIKRYLRLVVARRLLNNYVATITLAHNFTPKSERVVAVIGTINRELAEITSSMLKNYRFKQLSRTFTLSRHVATTGSTRKNKFSWSTHPIFGRANLFDALSVILNTHQHLRKHAVHVRTECIKQLIKLQNTHVVSKKQVAPNLLHNFYLVEPSPWPFVLSIVVFSFLTETVLYLNNSLYASTAALLINFVLLAGTVGFWFRDVIRETQFGGFYTTSVMSGLRLGMILFIVSEIMFFFAFFWAFFHSSILPNIEIGSMWPPIGIKPMDAWKVPFLNTLILLTSGATATLAHQAIIYNQGSTGLTGTVTPRQYSATMLYTTIALGSLFLVLQLYEYNHASFSISDSIFGSTFFLTTGFHGFHVLVGSIILMVCFVRHVDYQFSKKNHFGLEAGLWYWHFVDVVWLFLFIAFYWWGS